MSGLRYFLLLGALPLAACAGSSGLSGSSTAVQVAQQLPAPDSSQIAVDPSSYRIGPTDVLTISVFGAPELDREAAVDAAGGFAIPLAGSVQAAGRTPQQLAAVIEEKLRGPYLKDPKVTVNVKEGHAQVVTIDGQVREPGVYQIAGRMTLQQAVARAKGASDVANIRNVVVFRTVQGQKMAAMFSLVDIRSGRTPDPEIYGNDIVVVGEDATRRFLRDAAITFPLLGRFVPIL